MWLWWQNNGKRFNWPALPTELKEHIIEFCMHQPHTFGLYSEKRTNFNKRYQNNHRIQKPGPLEIVDQLGDWYQLLYVSHQVRAVTLRLCITGGSSLTRSKGLCITASSLQSFTEIFDRLGGYYQMTEPHSIPTSSAEGILSKCYSHFPRIYPGLRQYATFRHGIQKVSLGMGFLSFMDFFEVRTGRFQKLRKARGPTHHIFERLSSLNEIIIRLPLRPREGWINVPHAGGPLLFHHLSPCPRVLHRLIYERIAQVMASYNKVTLRNFIDGNEEQRFLSARAEATMALLLTKVQLEELYADSSGGVELPGGIERKVSIPEKAKLKHGQVEFLEHTESSFFPPLCHCDEPCALSLVLGRSEY